MSTLCAICGKKIILGYKGPNKELLCKECWKKSWEERRAEYLRSVIGEWQECPICGSKGCFEVKGKRFFQQVLLCKSCSAEWTLGPRKLTNLMLTKSDLNGKARKYIGKSHPPEWWVEEVSKGLVEEAPTAIVSIKKSDSFEYVKLFAKKYIEDNEIIFWRVINNILVTAPYDASLLYKGYLYKNIDKLRRLLAKNGFEFTEKAIEDLITEEIREQTYEKFKSHALSKEPGNLVEYITCFLEYFKDASSEHKVKNYVFYNTDEMEEDEEIQHIAVDIEDEGIEKNIKNTVLQKYENAPVDIGYLKTLLKPDFIDIGYLRRLLKDKKIEFEEGRLWSEIKKVIDEIELTQFEKELTISTKKVLQVTLEELNKMNGYEFERFLRVLYEKNGYKVMQTKLSKDQGADLVIVKDGERIVVQAKRYSNKVSNKAIQEVVAAIKHYGADRGIVVTTNEFTQSAMELAESNDIELVDRNKLKKLMENVI
ncbi:MAG: restriction endonuclease [Euryarchaeota archaeon]|nr:restriction endonuclease [Euryarchaeota archaeon]